jgi:serine/threonine-protein kinase
MIKRDGRVNLLVSSGVRPKAYKMPDLKGLSLEGAILIIESNNMLLGEIKFISKKNKPENVIVEQEPLFGNRVVEKTFVNITINRKSDQKSHEHLQEKKSGRLFRYRLKNGFLRRHIRIRLNGYGVSNDLYDDFVKPGEEIWLLIPKGNDLTLILYEDGELVRTQVFNSW